MGAVINSKLTIKLIVGTLTAIASRNGGTYVCNFQSNFYSLNFYFRNETLGFAPSVFNGFRKFISLHGSK